MPSLPAIALSGMSAAQLGLQTSAHNIANLGTANFRRQEVVQTADREGVSASVTRAEQPGSAIETDLVNQLRSKNAFLANLAVFRASDRAMGSLIDAVS
jgi:flagellar hook-associated protein FlgK